MIEFTLRHLRRHWRPNLAVLVCLTLAAALLATFSSYTVNISTQELRQNLAEAAPAERSLLITGNRYTFNEELYDLLRENLAGVLRDRIVIRHATSPVDSQPDSEAIDDRRNVVLLDLYSFSGLFQYVRVLEGRLPDQVRLREATEFWRPPPIEAVIGARAAEQSGYAVGDRLIGAGGYHRLDIVGIVEPLDDQDDAWGEDLSAFVVEGAAEPDLDVIALPLIIAPGSMRGSYPEQPIFLHEVSWRITLNRDLINVDRAESLHSDLVNFLTQTATVRASTVTGVVRILEDYLSRLSRVRMAFLLLIAQTLMFVLYTLTLFTSFIADRSQVELATLSGRGASPWQITRIFALENLFLALSALLLAAGLAQVGLRLWGHTDDLGAPAGLSYEAWLLAGIAVSLGWLALILPILMTARRRVLGWQHVRAQTLHRSAVERYNLDLYLLAFGGLLYWQLNRSGSFVMSSLRGSPLADPLLLIGPSVLLIGMAMVLMRIWPHLLRLVSWLIRPLRGTVLPMSLLRLAREPHRSGRAVLLVSLAAGLVFFTLTFGNSLAHNQEAMAHYLAGADLRISLDPETAVQDVAQLLQLPGIDAASPVLRGTLETELGQTIQLLAIDPATFARVAHYPRGLTDDTMPELMDLLQAAEDDQASSDALVPGLFSLSALPAGRGTGSRVTLDLAGHSLNLTVRATVDHFPTLSDPFAVVSLPNLEQQLDVGGLAGSGEREAWLTAAPAERGALADNPLINERLLDQAQGRLGALTSDALTQGTGDALRLNALVLVLFSLVAFSLAQYVAAQGQTRELDVLRTLGLSAHQQLALRMVEGTLVLLLGLVTGTAIGLGLSQIMIPYLSQAVAESLAGGSIARVVVDWIAVARVYGLMAAIYGGVLLLLQLALVPSRAHRVAWMGDE
jgi:hypothetical protein